MDQTLIEWTDATLNTAWGCTKVSEGCKNCYMYRLSRPFGRDPDVPTELNFENTKKRLAKTVKNGAKVIFVNSMTDTFHKDYSYDTIKTWIDLFAEYKDIQFQVLTKRIERALEYSEKYGIPDNVWIGTSIENNRQLHRLSTLKSIKAKIRFISFEPLLESIPNADLSEIQWVIVGGESDFKNPRPFLEDWAREIRDQCGKYKVPFFFKQMGGTKKITHADGVKTWGGNTIDGKKYQQMPVLLGLKESTIL